MIFVLATLWQQTLHEFAHFVAAILLHSKDVTLFHNYVQHDTSALSLNSTLVIAAAGPLFSLLVGVLFQSVCANFAKRNLLFLFLLYMSAFGYINFGGYLLVSPFFRGGDTGYIFAQLNFPLWLTILCAIGGCVFLFFSMKMLCKYFIEMGTEAIINDKAQRKAFIGSIIENPLYIGVAATTLLNLPVVTFLSLLYPICSPFTLFWTFGYLYDTNYPMQKANKNLSTIEKLSWPLITFFVVSAIVNRLLVYGVRF